MTYTVGDVTDDVEVENGKGEFTIKKGDYPAGGEFTVVASVTSKDKLTGDEAITLTLDNKPLDEDKLTTTAKFDTARIDNFENCVIDGLVEKVKAEGVCLEDGSAKNAEFTFGVKLSGAYNQDQTYYFEFYGEGIDAATEVNSLTYTVGDVTDDVEVENGKGEFTIKKGDYPAGGEFTVVASVTSKDKLTGDEAITLTLDNKPLDEDKLTTTAKFDTARIDNFENCVIDGLVEKVKAEGVCLEDGSAKNAEFTFGVKLSGAYNQDQTYYFEFYGEGIDAATEVNSLTYTVGDVTDDVEVENGKGEFTIKKGDYPAGGEFTVVASVTSKDKLTGDEAITLTLDNKPLDEDKLTTTAKFDTARIDNFENCVIDGLVEKVKAEGVCLEDGSAKNAEFTFGVTLSGSYNQDQEYFYEFSGNKDAGDYELIGLSVVYGDSVSPVEPGRGKAGSFVLPAEVSGEFKVLATIRAEEKLTGDEAITLTIDNQELSSKKLHPNDTALIDNFEDCVIDGLVEKVKAEGVCVEDGNAKTAEFTFGVTLSGSYNQDQEYFYEFSGNKDAGDYELIGLSVVYGDSVSPVEPGREKAGSFVLPAEVSGEFKVLATIRAEEKLTGDEAITLTIDNQELSSKKLHPNDTALIDNFEDCVIDGLVEKVKAEGVCVEDGNAKTAEFTFGVTLSGSYNQDQEYFYEFSGNKDAGDYELIGLSVVYGDSVSPVEPGRGKAGSFVLPAEVSGEFKVLATIRAEEKLTGDEAITLTIDNQELSSKKLHPNDTALIDNFEDCVIDGLVEKVKAEGVCLEDGSAKNAEFTFGVTLSGSYNQDQEYFYEFSGNKDAGDYELIGLSVVYGDSVSPVEPGRGKAGSFVLPAEVSGEFKVLATIRAEEKLTGDEAITLTIDNQELSSKKLHPNDTALIDNFEDCVIDGLVEKVKAEGVCVEDGNAKTAEFTFGVTLSGSYNQDQEYFYEFSGNKDAGDYELIGLSVVYGDSVSPVEPGRGKAGSFVLPAEVSGEFKVLATIRAEEKLTGDEAITLTIDNQELSSKKLHPNDTALIDNFEDCVIDGLVEKVKAEGVCLEDGSAKNAEFTFGVTLSGSYNQDQEYFYEFSGNKDAGDYELIGLSVVYGDSVSPVEPGRGKAGSFVLPAEVSGEFKVLATIRAEEKLTGDEAITLTIDNQELSSKKLHPNDTALIDNFEDCVIDGLVEKVKAEGVCVEDGSAKNAEFTFGVTLSGSYNQDQEYFYEFSGNKDAGDYELIGLSVVYGDSVSPVEPGRGKAGSFVLPAEVSGEFKVLATIRAEEKLTGDEAITLTIDNQELSSKKLHPNDTALIDNFEDCVIDGLVTGIDAEGACIDDGNAKVALFTFNVELSGAYNKEAQRYFYKFESNKALGDGYTVDQVWVNGIEIKTPAPEGGFELPQETAAGSDIQVQVQVTADEKLDGNEALKLTLDNQPLNERSFSAIAKIKNFDDCAIDGLVTGIDAEGACIDDGNAKVALFTFNVELSGAYNKETQRYFYKFESNKALGDGYTVDQVWVNGIEIKTPAPEGGFELPQETAAGSDIQVQVQVQVTADEKLDGNEALKLTLDNQPLNERSFSAIAKIKNFDDCAIDGLVTGIDAEGACIDDGNAKVALFTFNVELSGAYNKETQRYFYKFESNKALGDGYTVDQVWVNGIEIKTPAPEGGFELPQETAAGSDIQVQVQVTADEKLDGNEALKLTLDNQPLNERSFSAIAKIENFDDCAIDGLVTGIDAEGACIDDGNAKVALFTFNVELSGAYNKEAQRYFYKFESNKALGDGYTVDQVWVNGIEIKTPAPEGGFELPQETAAGSDIQVQVQVTADEKLDGNEALKLTLDNQPLNERSFSAIAKIENFDDCAIDGLVTGIDAEGACIDDGDAKVALFTFNVELSGAYNKETQRYFYKFESNKALGDGYTVDQVWVNGIEIKTPAPEGGFELPQETAAGSDIQVQVQVTADEKLDGNEALKLTLDNQPLNERSFSAIAKIENFDDCVYHPPSFRLSGHAACLTTELPFALNFDDERLDNREDIAGEISQDLDALVDLNDEDRVDEFDPLQENIDDISLEEPEGIEDDDSQEVEEEEVAEEGDQDVVVVQARRRALSREGDAEAADDSGLSEDANDGGESADDLDGGDDDDVLEGGKGSDELDGGSGDDGLEGGKGADDLDGGSGDDDLDGGSGSDLLEGGKGSDLLNGGSGIDFLDGGTGNDTLVGGAGADDFLISLGRDVIKDFNPDVDNILLPEPPVLSPGQMPAFTQEGDHVVIRDQYFETVIENSKLADVLKVTKANIAIFIYNIVVEFGGESELVFDYEFSSPQTLLDGYQINQVSADSPDLSSHDWQKQGSFILQRPENGKQRQRIRLEVEVEALEAMNGDEALTLTLSNSLSKQNTLSETANLRLDQCDSEPSQPPVIEIEPSGACVEDGRSKTGIFRFDVSLSGTQGQESQDYAYLFEGNKRLSDGYEVTAFYINGEAQPVPDREGVFSLPPSSAGADFTVEVEIAAESKLDGDEALRLTLDSVDQFDPDSSPTAVAKIENFDDCAIDGLVTGIDAEGACIDDGDAKVALFTFNVELSGAYNKETQRYFYKFESNKALGDGYMIDQVWVNGIEIKTPAPEGGFELPQETAAGSDIQVQVQVTADEKLDGNEALKLTLDNQPLNERSFSAIAKIENFDDCAIDGLVTGIDAEGACIDDGNAKVALFTFNVELSGAYNKETQRYFYKFESNKALGDGYTVDQVWVNGIEIKTPAPEGGFELPQETAAGSDIQVQVQVTADEKLDGNEALKLTLDNQPLNERSFSAIAKIENFDDCAIDGLVTGIDAEGACIDDGNAKVALFTFNVELSGAYNKETQRYFYKFESNKALGDGYTVDQVWVNGIEIKTPAPEGGFELPQETTAGSDIQVQVQVTADEKLDGKEALKLTLDNQPLNDRSFSAIAKIANFDDCAIDGLVEGIKAKAACVEDGNGDKATFAFEVVLNSGYNNRGQVFSYRFGSNKALGDGYEVTAFYVNGEKQDVPAKQGSFELPENSFNAVTKLDIQVDVQANGQLDGTESLTLMLDNTASPAGLSDDSPSATAVIDNFYDCPQALDETSDVALYLVLDNSTSMLLPDPSTTAANRKDRLEAQDRVALHSFEKGIRGAGYGFSRKGENSVLSSEQFRQALVNNGTQSLSEVLDGFDVIVNPDFDGQANAVTVHLITYGYAVEYGTLSFDQSSTDEAIKVAKTILDVKTPDQLYGNSIEGNSTWGERDLPQPDQNDLFQGEGRPSSNLYSGTEMLGALLGLEHLLKAQAKTRSASDLTTLVSMVTDGRPERRAWWDTRTGAGSDSLTGVSVPLPETLGGDAITSSGLIYDQEGNATYLENNAGKKQWKKMQRKLNKALDAIAAKSSNPAELALQVEVMAMGEGTDADFPAIYDDLFGKRTFDNSDGGWSYQVFNSFADLPDFLG